MCIVNETDFEMLQKMKILGAISMDEKSKASFEKLKRLGLVATYKRALPYVRLTTLGMEELYKYVQLKKSVTCANSW